MIKKLFLSVDSVLSSIGKTDFTDPKFRELLNIKNNIVLNFEVSFRLIIYLALSWKWRCLKLDLIRIRGIANCRLMSIFVNDVCSIHIYVGRFVITLNQPSAGKMSIDHSYKDSRHVFLPVRFLLFILECIYIYTFWSPWWDESINFGLTVVLQLEDITREREGEHRCWCFSKVAQLAAYRIFYERNEQVTFPLSPPYCFRIIFLQKGELKIFRRDYYYYYLKCSWKLIPLHQSSFPSTEMY